MKLPTFGKVAATMLATAALAAPLNAAPTYSGLNTIQYVVAYQSGLVTFTLGSSTISSPWAACNVNHQFTVNTTTVSGEAIYDVVRRAQQGVKGVYVVGTGNCTLMAGSEDVNYIQINP